MNILLTNDDGYESCGLMLLCEKLAEAGHEVYVVAPASQRSATSHSVNLRNEVTVRKLDGYCGAKAAYVSEGSPADCVKFASSALDVKFDLLVSGPNNGENSGYAVIYSGTVGAAEEGVICGIKSIALSRVGWFADGGSFYSAVEYFTRNLQSLYDACNGNGILNVNVPNLPLAEIKGVKVCPLNSENIFCDHFFPVEGEVDKWYIKGERLSVDMNKENDVTLNAKGYITVTPVSLNRTDSAAVSALKKSLEK